MNKSRDAYNDSKREFIKLMVMNGIVTEICDTLEYDGKQVNYFVIGTEEDGMYIEINKVLIHKDADISLVITEVGDIVKGYKDIQDTLNRKSEDLN